MSCPEIEKVYLYCSGELSGKEKSMFRRHLRQCAACDEAVALLKKTQKEAARLQERPSDKVRNAIFLEAKRKIARSGSTQAVRNSWIRPVLWGVPALAAIAVALIFIHRPQRQGIQNENLFQWQDDFVETTAAMDTEMALLQSRPLAILENNWDDEMDGLSTMSGDLDRIRRQIEELIETIYGL